MSKNAQNLQKGMVIIMGSTLKGSPAQKKSIKSVTAAAMVLLLLFVSGCTPNTPTPSAESSGGTVLEHDLQQVVQIGGETADVMRLMEFDGEVTVTDNEGDDITPTEGIRLHSGYTVATAESSHAYISLDDSKAIKLDEMSVSLIEDKDKQLLITLESGELFFNVTKPLEEDETMQIQTSNMMTGIRGTSGYVTSHIVDNSNVSSTTILTGKVVVSSLDDEQPTETALESGNTAVYDDREEQIDIAETKESDVPKFVKNAIEDDDDLREELEESDDFDLDELLSDDDDENDDDENDEDKDDNQDGENDDDDDDGNPSSEAGDIDKPSSNTEDSTSDNDGNDENDSDDDNDENSDEDNDKPDSDKPTTFTYNNSSSIPTNGRTEGSNQSNDDDDD